MTVVKTEFRTEVSGGNLRGWKFVDETKMGRRKTGDPYKPYMGIIIWDEIRPYMGL